MLRIAGLSLFLGALFLVAGLVVFYPPSAEPDDATPAILWDATHVRVQSGVGTIENNVLVLKVDRQGQGKVRLDNKHIESGAYPYLHLSLEEPANKPGVVISWTQAHGDKETYTYILESESRESMWLSTEELKGWSGELSALRLYIFAQPGETVRIRDLSLHQYSPVRQMLAVYSDLAAYEPWNRAAMNSNTGVTQVSSYYPVILATTLLLLSIFCYAMLLIFRSKLRFNWQVVALLFLACWVILDLTWQNRLVHQLVDTYRTFSGKNTVEKLTVGADATLYKFVAQFKPLIHTGKETRIFVASTDEYNGLRVAYFLYPINVYWPEPGRPFPPSTMLKRGDYVVVVNPTKLRFDRNKGKLRIPRRAPLDATLIFAAPSGILLRLD